MNYLINIEFTKNSEKAGKLTLTDSSGNVVLSKVPVAVPPNSGISFEKRNLSLSFIRREEKEADSLILTGSEKSKYWNAVNRLESAGVNKVVVSDGKPLFMGQKISYDNQRLAGGESVFILKENDFETLSKVINNPANKVTLSAEQVGFLWFPEKLDMNRTSLSADIKSVLDSNKSLDNNEKVVSERDRQEKERTQKTQKSNVFSTSNQLLKKEEKKETAKSQVSQKGSTLGDNAKNTANVGTSRTIGSKMSARPTAQGYVGNYNANSRVTGYQGDDLDPFDVIFMNAYPDLAPFYKPNSLLAWMTFFNRNDDISRQQVLDNINNVSGFENVGSADFKYTPSGYSVTMYEDENKQNVMGTLNYNGNEECYKVTSPNGETTYLQQDNNGIWNGCTQSDSSNEISYNFAQTNEGYVGNWSSSPADGVQFNSGMSVGYDYQNQSSLDQPYNMEEYKTYDMGSVSIDSAQPTSTYQSEPENKYENDWRNEPPPPPPPPPPEDNYSWSVSQDSYNSFSP